jgi:ubiquinol-cytochrome c reductase cytochrome b subunit
VLLLILMVMPWLGGRKAGHRFNLAFLGALFAGVVVLTALAVNEDNHNPGYLAAVQDARREAARVIELAQAPDGIPTTGAVSLLRNDPRTQGPKLFARNCASCHRYDGGDGLGGVPKGAPAASDLKGYASRAWLAGLLDPAQITGPHYFGGTKLKDSKMVDFVKKDVAGYSADQKTQLASVLTALSAEAGLKAQAGLDRRDAALIKQGQSLIGGSGLSCTDCHQFHSVDADATAPNLTGYGSREWLVAFISNPAHERFYGKDNDRMPAFGVTQQLSDQEIGLVADWLRGDWYVPEGGKAEGLEN